MNLSGQDAANILTQIYNLSPTIDSEQFLQRPRPPELQSNSSEATSDSDSDDVDWLDPDEEESSEDEFLQNYAKPGSQLCDFCERLLLTAIKGDRKDRYYRIPEHYKWFWNMKQSSRTCGLCWTMIQATDQHLAHSPEVSEHDRNMQLTSYALCSATGSRFRCSKEVMHAAGLHEFTLFIGTSDGMPTVRFLVRTDGGQGSIPQRAIWSNSTPLQLGTRLPVLHEWLDSCGSDHAKCRPRMQGVSELPTRLIDLFASSHMGYFGPRLILTHSLDRSTTRYTTLSHRWGDKQPVQTFKDNIQNFMKSIFNPNDSNILRIPKTFHDAFKITRALGLRYIWIDSICIIQDDLSDWQNEASCMAAVYHGSFLNIAAIDSPNCNGGCSLDLGWGATALTGPNMNGARAWVRGTPANRADVFLSQLNTRGWVFQELTLAPRILYCSSKQFYWQCNERVCSEDGYLDHDVPLNISIDRFKPADTREHDWGLMVRDFSQRSFTKFTDRLPALLGVVQHYRKENEYTFLLGLWKETFIDDLAWRTRQVERNMFHYSFPTERSHLKNVPSWSWLSLHRDKHPGGILYFPIFENRIIHTKVDTVEVKWESEPMISEISSTKLIVRGPLQKFSLQYDDIRRRLHPENGEERYDMDTYVIRLDEALETQPEYDQFLDYWCLQLDTKQGGRRKVSTFLVLEEQEGSGTEGKDKEDKLNLRRFRRVGCGRVEHTDVDFNATSVERIEII